jgi:hypothetical protein
MKQPKITNDMVDAFRRGDARQLARLLDLKPWQDNPLDIDDEPPVWMRDLREQLAERKRAIAIRGQLLDRMRERTERRHG